LAIRMWRIFILILSEVFAEIIVWLRIIWVLCWRVVIILIKIKFTRIVNTRFSFWFKILCLLFVIIAWHICKVFWRICKRGWSIKQWVYFWSILIWWVSIWWLIIWLSSKVLTKGVSHVIIKSIFLLVSIWILIIF
jgi:hypothetical protein